MNKDSSIKFRISKEEKEVLIKLAEKMNLTLTDYIIYCLNNSLLADYNNQLSIYDND